MYSYVFDFGPKGPKSINFLVNLFVKDQNLLISLCIWYLPCVLQDLKVTVGASFAAATFSGFPRRSLALFPVHRVRARTETQVRPQHATDERRPVPRGHELAHASDAVLRTASGCGSSF